MHDVIHTDQGPAFRNEFLEELTRLSKVVHSFATAYSKEENGIVERANQEVMRHLRDILFDARVHDKLSYEQLSMVQRIMNIVEKAATEVTPVELILNNSIRLSARILAPPGSNTPGSQVTLSDTLDNWVVRQHKHRHTSYSLTATYSLSTTHVLQSIQFTCTCCSHHLLVAVTNSYRNIADHSK